MQTAVNEQYIEFGIQQEKYAIRIQEIQEIVKMQEITPVPSMNSFVKGVINLRGKIIPVISLRRLFDLPDAEYTRSSRMIVVYHMDETIGIEVDYVNKVTRFPDVQLPGDQVGSVTGRYFAGIGMSDHGLTGILQLNDLLLQE
ncbi:chemotaxis protein CheW [Paenibacillus lemnae]|uniref:Purine-binding chemotaxis protein CheW n=1 Tax=Paenibacillus lemnae TaxID=1330551 RepID=A0A848M4M1_PAELE|nr:chemotaxis protein CheW [Paenibacillus lemnae]NMO95181.1 purine-binding chemotaxis protein CheW [Paenibacillus lemnae]